VDEENQWYQSIDGSLYTKDGKTIVRYTAGETEIVIPETVTSIGSYAFYNCSNLMKVVIHGGVTSIGYQAFDNCTKLTIYCEAKTKPSDWFSSWNYSNRPVVWDCNNNEIATDGCIYTFVDGLRYALNVADGVATVAGQPATITDVNIPASIAYNEVEYSVTSIGSYAFAYCDNLTKVVIPVGVTTIENYAFRESYNLTIYCEAESKPDGWASNWNYSGRPIVWNCGSNDVASDGNIYTVVGDFKYAIKNGVATVYKWFGKGNAVVIPAELTYGDTVYPVTAIGNSAFYNCDHLKQVEIGDHITSIGSYAFNDCDGLTEIVIPASVTSIGNYAFASCDGLEEVVIPSSVTSMGEYVFRECTKLSFIGCEIASKPNNWNSYWNRFDDKGNFIFAAWGYTGEKITYTFVLPDVSNPISVSTTSPIEMLADYEKEGYILVWYDNANFEGNLMLPGKTYYSATKTTLYAKWLTNEEFVAVMAGTSFEYAIAIEKGGSYSVVIDEAGEYVYFVFTATQNGNVTFKSAVSGSQYDTYGHLYNANGSQIASNNNGAGNSQFQITYNVVAGQTYYVGARMYSSSQTGTFTLVVS
jgi:hypothetical protein